MEDFISEIFFCTYIVVQKTDIKHLNDIMMSIIKCRIALKYYSSEK